MTAACVPAVAGSVPSVPYGTVSARMHGRVVGQRIPVDGTLELTYRCNLACVQCYCNLPAGDADARARELTTPEVRRLLDEIADAGCLWLLLTGGEILLRKDFAEIYAYAKRKGFLLTLFTNGIGVTEEVADRLAQEPPFLVEITLYGATEETYRRVTQRPGGHSRVLAAIDRLQARGVPLELKTTILEENAADLPAMRALADARGLTFRYSHELHARIDGVGKPVGHRLTAEHALELDRRDPRRWEELRQLFTNHGRGALANRSGDLFLCQAGISGFNINPYGKLLFCPSIETLGFDLRRMSFAEAWSRFAAIRATPAPVSRPCNECDLNIACGTCAGEGYLDSGDMTRGTEFHHRLTRLRAQAFGLKVRENGKGALIVDAP